MARCLACITPLAVPHAEALDIADHEIVTGISQDDYVLVTAPASGLKTIEDMKNAFVVVAVLPLVRRKGGGGPSA